MKELDLKKLDLELLSLFLQEKPVRAVLTIHSLGPTYAAVLAREIETTFPHAIKIISRLEERGVIATQPDRDDKRIKTVEMTPAGSRIAELLLRLLDAVEASHKEREKSKEKTAKIKSALEKIDREELLNQESLKHQDTLRIRRRLGPYMRELKKMSPPARKELEEKIEEIIETARKLSEES